MKRYILVAVMLLFSAKSVKGNESSCQGVVDSFVVESTESRGCGTRCPSSDRIVDDTSFWASSWWTDIEVRGVYITDYHHIRLIFGDRYDPSPALYGSEHEIFANSRPIYCDESYTSVCA